MAPLRSSVLEPVGRAELLGAELAAWLRGAVIGLVNDRDTLTIVPRWEAPDTLVLVIRAARGPDVGRLVGRRGAVLNGLRAVARAVGVRHGLRLGVEVAEA